MFGGRIRTSTLVLIVAFFARGGSTTPTSRREPPPSHRPRRWCRPASCPTPTTPGCRAAECSGRRRPLHAYDADPDDDDRRPTEPRRRHDDDHHAAVPAADSRRRPAGAVLPAELKPHPVDRRATAAGARSGCPTSRATGQLTSRCQRNSPLHWRAVMITLDHVSKQYKASARPALEDVNVKIDKGEFVFLIGPSGSGKSTFMRLLLGAEKPTTGDVRVSKFHVNKLPGRHVPRLRQVIGCVFQDFRLLQQKTVFENVAFALEVIGKRSDAINRVVPEVLETVGLSGKANRLPHELSGGEQQRVAIARAFVNRPLVLLADEPTGNLDPDTSKDIMDLLERINRTGTTVLMATHDHHIVDSMRQRVVELSLGRLVRDEQRGIYGMDR